MIDKLRPCPFCGNDRVLLRNVEYDKTFWLVQCNQCHSEFTVSRWVKGKKSSNHDRLIKAWNRRDCNAK